MQTVDDGFEKFLGKVGNAHPGSGLVKEERDGPKSSGMQERLRSFWRQSGCNMHTVRSLVIRLFSGRRTRSTAGKVESEMIPRFILINELNMYAGGVNEGPLIGAQSLAKVFPDP